MLGKHHGIAMQKNENYRLHFKKKSTSEHLFWCFRLSQIEDLIQYLEGPNSTWKDHDRHLGVHLDQDCEEVKEVAKNLQKLHWKKVKEQFVQKMPQKVKSLLNTVLQIRVLALVYMLQYRIALPLNSC